MKKYSPRIRLSPEEYEMILASRGTPTKINILADKVAKKLKGKEKTIIELADNLNVAPKEIIRAIEVLKEQHIMVESLSEGTIQLSKDIEPKKPLKIDFAKYKEIETPIGVVADTHIGSKYERLDVLNALYDRFEYEGVENVYHCGYWIDGECRFNKFDIYVRGFEEQINNFVEKYPQKGGIKTHFISGDDHEGWFVQREHINVGKRMEQTAREEGRNDLIDLGYMERDIEFKQQYGKSVVRVIHPGGGSTYAVSYTTQKYAESLQGGEKPAIVLVGHFHKFDYSYPREIHIIQCGTTQDQTPFMRKRKIQAHVGGCILWLKQSERGIFTSVKVEWIPFYDKKYYVYKW